MKGLHQDKIIIRICVYVYINIYIYIYIYIYINIYLCIIYYINVTIICEYVDTIKTNLSRVSVHREAIRDGGYVIFIV